MSEPYGSSSLADDLGIDRHKGVYRPRKTAVHDGLLEAQESQEQAAELLASSIEQERSQLGTE